MGNKKGTWLSDAGRLQRPASLALISLLVLPGFLQTGVLGTQTSAVDTSGALVPSTSKICRSYHQTGFGIDKGTITYCFALNGAVYYYDDWSPQTNFTLNPFTVSLSSTILPIAVTLWQNSTTVAYNLQGTSTVSGKSYSGNVWVYYVQQAYEELVIVSGTITGTTGTFKVNFPFGEGSGLSWCGSACYSLSKGHLGFDWSADHEAASYNNATKTLAFTVGNSFYIDPMTIDGIGSCSVNNAALDWCSFTFSTVNANDLLIEAQDAPTCGDTTSTPTLPGYDLWPIRKSIGRLCTHYAVKPASGSITVKCSLGTATATKVCMAFALSGANTASPFDGDGCVLGNNPVPVSCSSMNPIITTNANDMIFGFIGCEDVLDYQFSCTPTKGGSYNLVNLKVQGNCSSPGQTVCAAVGAENLEVFSAGSYSPDWSFQQTLADHPIYEVIGDAVRSSNSVAKWQGIVYTGISPPDVTIDAGPRYVMEMVKTSWRVWDKNSGTVMESGSLASFFGTGTDIIGDQRILYDPVNKTWFASVLDQTANGGKGQVWLKTSKSDDPRPQSGPGWYSPSVKLDETQYNCLDQPSIGTSDGVVVISAYAFLSCLTGGPGAARVWVIKKADLMSGSSTPQKQLFSGPDGAGYMIRAAKSLSPTKTLYLMRIGNLGNDRHGDCDSSTRTGYMYTVTGVPPSAAFSTNPPSIDLMEWMFPAPYAQQNGTSWVLDTGGCQPQSVTWRSGSLWFGVGSRCSFYSTLNCIGLYQILTANSYVASHKMYGDSLGIQSYFYPALQVDQSGNLAVIFGYSSSGDYPGLKFTFWKLGDQLTGSPQTPTLLQAGSSYFYVNTEADRACDIGSYCRYGDYFGAGMDPNGYTVWIAGEFAKDTTQHTWSTEIAAVVSP